MTEETKVDEKEERIKQLEARLAKIEEIEKRIADSQPGGATFPGKEDEATKLKKLSVQEYGPYSPYYGYV